MGAMPHATHTIRQREEKALDKSVQRLLGWDGFHNFCSTPLWVNTMLNALPDSLLLSRVEDEWSATTGEVTVTGWTLPVALGRLLLTIDKIT